MKAVRAGKPGKVEIADFPDPILQEGEVILAPLACGVCSTDIKLVRKGADNTGYALGHELAGVVVETSPQSGWKVGQRVVAAPYLPCGICYYCLHHQPTLCTNLYDVSFLPGGLAERVRAPRDLTRRGLLEIPSGLSPEVAALAEPVGCTVKGIEDSGLRPGDSVLVIGDGPMGMMSAAVARAYGAYPVMVAGMLPHRLAVAEQYYADVVVNVTHEELRPIVDRNTAGRGVDVVMVAVSSAEALASGMACVRPGGMVNAFAGVPKGTTVDLDMRTLHYQQIHLTGSFGTTPEYMAKALNLFVSDRVPIAPLVTGRFQFDAVVDAIAYAAEREGLKAVVLF